MPFIDCFFFFNFSWMWNTYYDLDWWRSFTCQLFGWKLEDLLADSLLFMDLTINCRSIFKWFKLWSTINYTSHWRSQTTYEINFFIARIPLDMVMQVFHGPILRMVLAIHFLCSSLRKQCRKFFNKLLFMDQMTI